MYRVAEEPVMTTMEAQQFFVAAMSPEHRADPYPLYAEWLARGPMAQLDDDTWLVFGHAEVTACLKHPLLSSNESHSLVMQREVAQGRLPESAVPSLLFMDPPDHTRLRGLVARAFTPRRVEGLRARTQALVDDLLDGLAGEVDLIPALAYPLPVQVICALLGVPEEDEEVFSGWSKVLARSIDPSILRTPEVEAAIAQAAPELEAYLERLVERRTADPGDDLISALLAVEAEGERITHQELLDLCGLLLVAGHETTVNLIGNGTLALLRNPGQRLVPGGGIDELLRYDSPVQMNIRVATDDVEVGGIPVHAGSELILVLAAANRDPLAFPRPDELLLGRDARRHVAFGGGIHHCLGAALARMEGELAITALFDRFPATRLAGDPELRPTFTLRGQEHLPVDLGPA
jgi:cytochrome P450